MGYLSNAGLSYFFGKLKTIFAPISHGHGGATQSAAGFMSAADKKKLDGIAEGANKYSLPTATSNVLGGVKTGANITNSSGVLSVTAANVTNALGYTPPKQDTNTWRGVQNNLTSDATDQSLSAAQGKVLKGLVDGKAPASHTHTKSQITDFPALGTAAAKNVRTLTARGSSGWKNTATDQQYVPDMSFIANWNGSYDGTGSNLVYCCMGAFGTIVTKNTSDYAVAGHTHNYAGSSSAGGAATSANKVNAALTINLNGTSQGAWDGSSAKSISITAASVGATSVTISRW